jgi:uncharacterized membrane protein YjjB (DUF3815 family)
MIYLELIEKGIWAGFAALGFAILFNVPVRTLFSIWLLGALGGLLKFSFLSLDINIILSSLAGATLIGVLSTPLSHKIHVPPMIFSIPAVIPMVPGAFAYRMMLGLINLSVSTSTDNLDVVLIETFQNGMKTILILLSLSVGVIAPMLITRKESVKQLRFRK